MYRLVDGQNRVKQRSVSRGPVQCPHCGRQGFDEALILQLGYVLSHRVGTHACAFSNFSEARVAHVFSCPRKTADMCTRRSPRRSIPA